jgi:hypothetical protein
VLCVCEGDKAVAIFKSLQVCYYTNHPKVRIRLDLSIGICINYLSHMEDAMFARYPKSSRVHTPFRTLWDLAKGSSLSYMSYMAARVKLG